MERGARCAPSPSLASCADLCARELERLPAGCHRLVNPHVYKVSLSYGLNKLRLKLMAEVKHRFGR